MDKTKEQLQIIMTGNIYIIKNNINDKVYIGKTFKSVQCRFKEHIRESRKDRNENRKLHRAIRKYGEDNFYIEELEINIEENILSNKEIKYINMFNSFNEGYNTTMGGEGTRTIDIPDKEIIEHYLISKSVRHTAKHFNISQDSTSLILHNNKIEIFKPNSKRIKIIELDLEFETITDCEKYLFDNNYTTSTARNSIAINIKRSIKREGKYLGFTFLILN